MGAKCQNKVGCIWRFFKKSKQLEELKAFIAPGDKTETP